MNGTFEKVELVINDLEQLINLTEEKYAYIYECLPAGEQQVELGIREVEILLNHLIFNGRPMVDEDGSVTVETLNKILTEFEEVTDTFLNQELISLLLRTFLNKSGEERQSFSELVRVAREVEEALSVLRDLALNSIIFSIQKGEEGAAFQILADRINQVSVELGTQFGSMNATIGRLNEWNEDFQRKLVEFIEYEKDIKSKYQDKFQADFQQITATLKTVCGILKDNLENTKTAFSDVGRIMVMIQNQDIIRQNVENLVKCLKIVLEKKASLQDESMEKCLDYVVFANRVMELSNLLVDNIENSLDESILGLGELLEQMHDTVTDLETDTFYLSKLFAGLNHDNNAEGVLGDVFGAVLGQVADLLEQKEIILSRSGLLSKDKEIFIELMEAVEIYFADINGITKGLKKMKVLLKIELARINLDKDFISAVDQVIDTINDNQQLFQKLRSYFVQNINEFDKALKNTEKKLDLSSGILGEAKLKLEAVRRLARGAVLASGSEMKEVFTQLKQPYMHLADAGPISGLIAGVRVRITECQDDIRQIQDQLFRKYGISCWEEKEDNLKLLMDQFTCYVEREAMSDVTGQALDNGSAGGDITLF